MLFVWQMEGKRPLAAGLVHDAQDRGLDFLGYRQEFRLVHRGEEFAGEQSPEAQFALALVEADAAGQEGREANLLLQNALGLDRIADFDDPTDRGQVHVLLSEFGAQVELADDAELVGLDGLSEAGQDFVSGAGGGFFVEHVNRFGETAPRSCKGAGDE